MTILKKASLLEDILTLGVEGENQIWRDAKIRAIGKKRAQTLVEAARHSVGTKEGATAAQIEIRMLLEIKGVGIKNVLGFFAEVGDISSFSNLKEL